MPESPVLTKGSPPPGGGRPRLFCLQGTRAARLLGPLRAEYEVIPLAAADRPRVEESSVLLIDGSDGDVARAMGLRDRHAALAVVAVLHGDQIPAIGADIDAYVAPDAAPAVLAHAVASALRQARLRQAQEHAAAQLARLTREFQSLNAIGIRLSAESDTEALLDLILSKAREITQSDAGSLYLIEDDDTGSPRLRFTLVQNDSVPVTFRGATLPVSSQSVAGHVALTGQMLHLDDAYFPPLGSPFRIDRTYDEETGYRSKSMLVVPMKNPKDQVIGVLQLINCKADPSLRLDAPAATERGTVPFPARFQDLALSVASQAAVAIEKARLYQTLRTTLDELEASHQRIVQSERLMALGEMAGGIAHDFNNLLTIILGRTQLLLSQVQDPEVHRQLGVIERAGTDGAQTVRRIQEFTRVRRTRPFQPVDLNEVVEAVVDVTRCRWRDVAQASGVTYDIRVDTSPLPPVTGDPMELREALTNLVLNAFDAMPAGGRLTLTTAREGTRVRCTVADTGVGMAEEVRRRVFEPFFTTKGQKVSGLGLSVTYGVVVRHGGEIVCESRPGQGTTFTLRFPVGDHRQEPPVSPPAAEAPRGLAILVIDDEPEVRQVLVDLLTRRGHTIVAEPDGPSGLARLGERPFDLVITDLGMPGLSGWDVAAMVKRQGKTPVALITGWSDQLDIDEARVRQVDYIIPKPFRLEQILKVLAQAVAR
jgi:signal transduction histidine kinase/CheY-like chemotaxis protein